MHSYTLSCENRLSLALSVQWKKEQVPTDDEGTSSTYRCALSLSFLWHATIVVSMCGYANYDLRMCGSVSQGKHHRISVLRDNNNNRPLLSRNLVGRDNKVSCKLCAGFIYMFLHPEYET